MKHFEIEKMKRTGHFTMTATHFHDNYEVYYLLSGERCYFIKDRTYFIKKGDLIFIDKNELHKTGDTGVPNHERILIHFTEELLASISGGAADTLLAPFRRQNSPLSLKLNEQTVVENLLFAMLSEKEHKQAGSDLYIKALLTQLLLYCARRTEEQPPASAEEYHPLRRKMTEIAGYITRNYRNPLTLAVISDTFYISPGYFSRSFKEITGFSFVEYLNNVRIREAQRLLRETDAKVTEVAERTGFDSIAHFGRVYKQLTKQAPLEYRKMARSAYRLEQANHLNAVNA